MIKSNLAIYMSSYFKLLKYISRIQTVSLCINFIQKYCFFYSSFWTLFKVSSGPPIGGDPIQMPILPKDIMPLRIYVCIYLRVQLNIIQMLNKRQHIAIFLVLFIKPLVLVVCSMSFHSISHPLTS